MNAAVLKGSLTLGAADFGRKVLLAGTLLLCARFLPPGTFGDYAFLLSFYQIFSVLGGAGIPNCLLRAVARDRRSGISLGIASILARLVYIVPTGILMYVGMKLMGFADKYSPALGLLVLMMVVRGAAENIAFIFQGYEDQINCAKVGVSQSAVTLLATLAICLTSKNLLLLIGAHVLGGFTSAIYGIVLLRFKGRQDQGFAQSITAQAQSLLRESHWLNAGAFVASAYNRADVLLLRRVLTSEAVAVYAAPYRILDLTQIVPSSLMATILPGLCRSDDTWSGVTHPRTAMRLLLAIALAIIVVVTVAAPWIAVLLFGPNYQRSSPVLQILIWATVPMFWNFVLVSQLIANSFDRAILVGSSIALAVNVGLNLLLIPKFGYLACAAVTVVTEIAFLAANLRFVSKIGVAAVPASFGRLALAMVFVVGFCLCWVLGGFRFAALSGVLLLGAGLALPIFRNDFSVPAQGAPMEVIKPVSGINA